MKGMKGMKAAAVDGQITSTGAYIRAGFSGSCEKPGGGTASGTASLLCYISGDSQALNVFT